MVRALARGEEIEIPVRVGLVGVLVEAGTNVSSDHGLLIRPADARDEEFIMMTPLGGGVSYHDLGRQIIIKLCGDVVVEATARCRIIIGTDESVFQKNPPTADEDQTKRLIHKDVVSI